MKNFFTYLDIPTVPENLIEPSDVIINDVIKNKPPKPEKHGILDLRAKFYFFQLRPASKELVTWVRDIFKMQCFVQYQVIRSAVPIHIDSNRNVVFNYLIETGGPHASTCFYDGRDERKIICSEIIKPKIWHRLKTEVHHAVRNFNLPRIAITVHVPDYKWDEPFLNYSAISI